MPVYKVNAVTTIEWVFYVDADGEGEAHEFIGFNFGECCIRDFSDSEEDEWKLTKTSESEIGTGQHIHRREEDGGDYKYGKK